VRFSSLNNPRNNVIQIGLILLLIIVNGLFAMSEMALVSARKSRLRQLAERGGAGEMRALELSAQPSRFLSTVQVGITTIGILSGALGEAALTSQLEPWVAGVPELAPYADKISLAITVSAITYLSLIIGELVPKRIALLHAERIAATVARPMDWLSLIALPVVKLLSLSTDLVLRLFGIRPIRQPSVTEEEIKLLLQQGTQEGVFVETEQELVENILRLDTRKVGAIMTPRKDITYLDITKPYEVNRGILMDHPHWIIPLCRGGVDNVLGFIKTKDVLNRLLEGYKPDLAELVTPALFVPNSLSLMQLLEHFKQSHLQTALVVDEYGELTGLVTLTDVLEAIVGDIASEMGEEEPLASQREDGSWLIDGMLDIERFKELFDLEELPEEKKGNFHTIAGFVMLRLGNVPKVTDTFDYENLHFEVVDMDRNRVDKVLVSRIPKAPAD
jgi:putative hemolysin